MNIIFDKRTQEILQRAIELSKMYRHEYVTPEHLLFILTGYEPFASAIQRSMGHPVLLEERMKYYLDGLEQVDEEETDEEESETLSIQMETLLNESLFTCRSSDTEQITLPILTQSLLNLTDCYATTELMEDIGGKKESAQFLAHLIDELGTDDANEHTSIDEKMDDVLLHPYIFEMNQGVANTPYLPIVGRKDEIRRMIQVLCRYSKNNPLLIGESGVGKTTIAWGLAELIEKGEVPEPLKYVKIFNLNTSGLMAGAQYKGDLEKIIRDLVSQVVKHEGLLYIDDIHLIMGASNNSDGTPSAYDILKPYLEANVIQVIGTTTYADYKRNMERNTGVLRFFQKIDIEEPDQQQTLEIAMAKKQALEKFHLVRYEEDVVRYAVTESSRYINDRFQPDKTLDLLDEAGAAHTLDCEDGDIDIAEISKTDVAKVLAKICRLNALSDNVSDTDRLSNLYNNIASQIYGQDDAVRLTVEAIQMAKAGLNDDDKPLASFLFVGPTGVGKTEVARVLSQQLGIELIRFDMSEYVEKHTVAKLIGSPAGYIGYEDGGLLTDAIRKNPNCVLLLDEIEKAHEDIYNILLQVMDYARLTDNRGQKADFRSVVLIMTSNAGAQFAAQANVGFTGHVTRGEAMLKQVKKTFKPEFLNRLTSVVSFNDMDENMAQLILRKKLNILEGKLKAKGISLDIDQPAFEHLLKLGFTKEYGAREIDRVIARNLKPLLMKEILFGSLKNGGKANIKYTEEDGIQIG